MCTAHGTDELGVFKPAVAPASTPGVRQTLPSCAACGLASTSSTMLSLSQFCLLATATLGRVAAFPYNTFDGPGFPACHDVSAVYNVSSVDEMIDLVKDAAASGTPVRASGKGHMWYDTMCQDSTLR